MGPRAPLLQHRDNELHPAVFEENEENEEVAESVDETMRTRTTLASRFLSRRRALLLGDVSLTNMFGRGLARSSDFWLLFVILSLRKFSSYRMVSLMMDDLCF